MFDHSAVMSEVKVQCRLLEEFWVVFIIQYLCTASVALISKDGFDLSLTV